LSEHKKVLIIGGGATGLASAYELQKRGHEVTIVEKSNNLGGLAGGFQVQGTSLELFYHHLFTTDKAAIELIREIGLGDKLKFYPSNNSIFYDGKAYPFSTPLEMLTFKPIGLIGRIRFALSSAYLKFTTNWRPLEKQLALEWMNKWAGKQATDVIWRPLITGKFGDRAQDIAMSWLWARIHNRSFQLGYMDGGFQQVYETLGEKITTAGGVIKRGVGIDNLQSDENSVTAILEGGEKISADMAIVTVSEPLFAKMANLELSTKSHKHLGATCFTLELDKSLINNYWMNINDTSFPFLAVVEHTNMVGTEAYGGRHIVYVGNYVPHDDWRFTTDPAELLEKYIPYIQKINPEFDRSWIKDYHFAKAPFTQPVVDREYGAQIPPHQTALPNVWLATMAQIYPEDRGQNYAFAMAKKLVARILGEVK
jgi:protoporphyrinogen oxidase